MGPERGIAKPDVQPLRARRAGQASARSDILNQNIATSERYLSPYLLSVASVASLGEGIVTRIAVVDVRQAATGDTYAPDL